MDKETKLMILNLLSATDNPKDEEEILKFLFAWENNEAQTEKDLLERLENIIQQTQEEEYRVQQQLKKELNTVTDDIDKQQRIDELKKHIESL